MVGASDYIEFRDAVKFVIRVFRRIVAFAFLRDTMDKDGAFHLVVADVLQNWEQVI